MPKVKEYGYEYEIQLDKELWEKTQNQVVYEKFLGAMCLRSGRDALKIIAREFEPALVLMPALSCDSMIIPFTLYQHTVRYYKLNENYSINIEDLHCKAQEINGTILFLYMDYFGNKMISDDELYALKTLYPNMIFIEDRTHTLLSNRNSGFNPEFIVASLRKWLEIPDGGLLWTNVKIQNNTFSNDLKFSKTKLYAQCMRKEFLETGRRELKTEFRQIFSTVTDLIDEDLLPARMSAYAYEIAKRSNLKMIYDKRKSNAEILIGELRNAGYNLVQSESGVSDVYVSILVKNRDLLQKKLSETGIFCTIIWPLNVEQKNSCTVAKFTEEHILSIYCDQRYTARDMKYVAAQIVRLGNE